MKIRSISLLCACFLANMQGTNVYFTAMAGGAGTRLWPMSRDARPKQFLSLNNKTTLLQDTFDRAHGVCSDSKFWVVTTRDYYMLTNQTVGSTIERILVEPAMRNTGPAILLSCMTIAQIDPDAIAVFLPSDAYISPAEAFRDSLRIAIEHCKNSDDIVLLGMQPTYPATGYGYIQYQPGDTRSALPVTAFHEKPSVEKAQEYIRAGDTLWNAGIFCTKVRVFIKEFETYAPDIVEGMRTYLAGTSSYTALRNISVDFAVMEKSKHVRVVPLNVTWSDVGNIREFLNVQYASGIKPANVLELAGAKLNLVSCVTPEKPVVIIGLENICVVDTGDALVISDKVNIEKTKDAQAALKKMGKACV